MAYFENDGYLEYVEDATLAVLSKFFQDGGTLRLDEPMQARGGPVQPGWYGGPVDTPDVTPDDEPDDDEVITVLADSEYRSVAADWHGGQSSALYAFASTGNVLLSLSDEVADIADNYVGDPDDPRQAATEAELVRFQAFVRGLMAMYFAEVHWGR